MNGLTRQAELFAARIEGYEVALLGEGELGIGKDWRVLKNGVVVACSYMTRGWAERRMFEISSEGRFKSRNCKTRYIKSSL